VAGTDFHVQIFSWESSLIIFHPSSKYSEMPSSPQENFISILFFSGLVFSSLIFSKLFMGYSLLVDVLQEIKKIAIRIINGNCFIIFIFLTIDNSKLFKL